MLVGKAIDFVPGNVVKLKEKLFCSALCELFQEEGKLKSHDTRQEEEYNYCSQVLVNDFFTLFDAFAFII